MSEQWARPESTYGGKNLNHKSDLFLAVWTELVGSSTSSGFETAKLVSTWESRSCLCGTDITIRAPPAAQNGHSPVRGFRLELGLSVDPAAGATQQCRATAHSASHCSQCPHYYYYCLVREVHIFRKKKLFFNPVFQTFREKGSLLFLKKFYDISAVRAREQSSNFGGLSPPGFCPGSTRSSSVQPDTN